MSTNENPDAPENVAARKNQEDPLIMYLIVRESLGMSTGKTTAQGGHAVGMLDKQFYSLDKEWEGYLLSGWTPNSDTVLKASIFKDWQKQSFRKVVLGASDKEWAKLKEDPWCKANMVLVVDAGLTEIEPGSETVIGLWPMKKSQAPKIVKKLQVLK